MRAAESLQGTAERYARLSGHGAPARFTTAGGHDAHFAALPDAVAAAEDTHVADAVTVLRRDTTVVYRNERRPDGLWARPAGTVTALPLEQARPYTEAEAARFWEVQRRLRAAMPHYRDALAGIARRAWPLMPPHLQPHRLTGPPAVAALPARAYEPGVCSSFSRAA
ncbi:zeta toxin family protein [Streptomyces sp. SudanB182_2057]|uniref:zeta toxin family protein n=1 Tax=Streptomyces sp. SudanB182_2057 TaxID=3035281 RepID=UPI003F555D20